MNTRAPWSRIFIIVGSLAMLVGALTILPRSGLVALGTFLGLSERRLIAYRTVVFILIAQSRPRLLHALARAGVIG